jgi:hypothetical protein
LTKIIFFYPFPIRTSPLSIGIKLLIPLGVMHYEIPVVVYLPFSLSLRALSCFSPFFLNVPSEDISNEDIF